MRTIIAAIAVSSTLVAPATANPPATTERGHAVFKQYCASCHGPGAKGDGLLGEAMRVQPPDLTKIAERRAGQFPKADIIALIDGRTAVVGHGDRDMPVWGERLMELAPGRDADKAAAATSKIRLIVQYLESIQVAPAAPKK